MNEEKRPQDLTPRQKAHLEGHKLLYDALKHLTTLSTGSILLLTTFLKEIFQDNRRCEVLIPISLWLFILSIIFSVITMIILSDSVFRFKERMEMGSRKGSFTFKISLGAFIIGISVLVIFATVNFYGMQSIGGAPAN